jgi:hypothetical protein
VFWTLVFFLKLLLLFTIFNTIQQKRGGLTIFGGELIHEHQFPTPRRRFKQYTITPLAKGATNIIGHYYYYY